MANFPAPSRTKLPPPPPPSETADNLSQPEYAPSAYLDGRSLRATGRTLQFTTRITEELQRDIKVFASRHGMKLNDFIERAFRALERELGK